MRGRRSVGLPDKTASEKRRRCIVRSSAERPTWDHSIKTLAKFLGFSWRDSHPSGVASIEWYDRFVETSDRALPQRVLDYNENDCRAMAVLLDAIRAMA